MDGEGAARRRQEAYMATQPDYGDVLRELVAAHVARLCREADRRIARHLGAVSLPRRAWWWLVGVPVRYRAGR